MEGSRSDQGPSNEHTAQARNGVWATAHVLAARDPFNNRKISPLQDARNYDMEFFPGFLVRCVLDCGCPLSSAEGGAFFGLRAGHSSPSQGAAPRRKWGRRRGNAPAPAIFAQLLGGKGLWACQKGQIGQKMVRFGQLGGGSDISSRRADRATTHLKNRVPKTHIKIK
jgi:hypothetical protein